MSGRPSSDSRIHVASPANSTAGLGDGVTSGRTTVDVGTLVAVGSRVGESWDSWVGVAVGSQVGEGVDSWVGAAVGSRVGEGLGTWVGLAVGGVVGVGVASWIGTDVLAGSVWESV